jgi:hypothetical protein
MTKSATKSAKSARTTFADSLAALPMEGFAKSVRDSWASGSAAIRAVSVAMFAATIRKDVRSYAGDSGKGAFAWFIDECAGNVSKGRFSQYVTFGRWIDAAERIGKPGLVASEYDARALQSAYGKSEAETESGYLSGMSRADVDTLVESAVKSGKSGKSAKDSDGESDDAPKSGKSVVMTARGLADAIGDMVAAVLTRKDCRAEDREMLRDALRAASDLCE